MKTRNYIVLFTICSLTFSCAFIQTGLSTNFNRYSTSGRIQPGMSDHEVRKLIGSPKKVASLKLKTDTRSLWTYKQRTLENPVSYFFFGIITFGIAFLYPAQTEYHYLVFSDNILVGWDMPDPYAPDLIIEKRLR